MHNKRTPFFSENGVLFAYVFYIIINFTFFLFCKDVSELGKIKISSLDIKTNEVKEICILDNGGQAIYDIADKDQSMSDYAV